MRAETCAEVRAETSAEARAENIRLPSDADQSSRERIFLCALHITEGLFSCKPFVLQRLTFKRRTTLSMRGFYLITASVF